MWWFTSICKWATLPQRSLATLGFPLRMPFPQGKCVQSSGCLISRWFPYWSPYRKGKGGPKKEAGQSRLVGGKFNQQGNLYTGLPGAATRLVDVQTTCQNLNSLYRGLNWVQSHTPSTWLNASLLFQSFVFGEAPSGWKASRMHRGIHKETSIAWRLPGHWWSHSLDNLPQWEGEAFQLCRMHKFWRSNV